MDLKAAGAGRCHDGVPYVVVTQVDALLDLDTLSLSQALGSAGGQFVSPPRSFRAKGVGVVKCKQ